MTNPDNIHPALIRRPVQDALATVRAVLTPEEMALVDRVLRSQWPKRCGCGHDYEPRQWEGLPMRYQRTDAYSTNEARDCACGSTLEILLCVHDPEAM